MHPGISAFSATLKSIDYNVAMTFILTNKINNNNNNNNFPLGKIYTKKLPILTILGEVSPHF